MKKLLLLVGLIGAPLISQAQFTSVMVDPVTGKIVRPSNFWLGVSNEVNSVFTGIFTNIGPALMALQTNNASLLTNYPGIVNITDFGAVSAPDSNCLPAIKAAIAYVSGNGGGTVRIPPGTNGWMLSSTLIITNGVTLEGNMNNLPFLSTNLGTYIYCTNQHVPVIQIGDGKNGLSGVTLSHINISAKNMDAASGYGSTLGLLINYGVEKCLIEDCIFSMNTNHIHMLGTNTIVNTGWNRFHNCWFQQYPHDSFCYNLFLDSSDWEDSDPIFIDECTFFDEAIQGIGIWGKNADRTFITATTMHGTGGGPAILWDCGVDKNTLWITSSEISNEASHPWDILLTNVSFNYVWKDFIHLDQSSTAQIGLLTSSNTLSGATNPPFIIPTGNWEDDPQSASNSEQLRNPIITRGWLGFMDANDPLMMLHTRTNNTLGFRLNNGRLDYTSSSSYNSYPFFSFYTNGNINISNQLQISGIELAVTNPTQSGIDFFNVLNVHSPTLSGVNFSDKIVAAGGIYVNSGKTITLGGVSNVVALGINSNGAFVASSLNLSGLGFLTPQQFGATGDGSTDDTAAWQAMINNASYSPATNQQCMIPSGTNVYSISTLFITNSSITIWGNGATLKHRISSAPMIYVNTNLTNVIITSLILDGNQSVITLGPLSIAVGLGLNNIYPISATHEGISFPTDSQGSLLGEIVCKNFLVYGFVFVSKTDYGHSYAVSHSYLRNLEAYNCGIGYRNDANELAPNVTSEYVCFDHFYSHGNGVGFYETCGNVTYQGAICTSNTCGFYIYQSVNGLHGTIANCMINHNPGRSMWFTSPQPAVMGFKISNSYIWGGLAAAGDIFINNCGNITFDNCRLDLTTNRLGGFVGSPGGLTSIGATNQNWIINCEYDDTWANCQNTITNTDGMLTFRNNHSWQVYGDTDGTTGQTNSIAGLPAKPFAPGASYNWNSNGYQYILMSTNGLGGVSATWTATNRVF